jgi:hypothetical protein
LLKETVTDVFISYASEDRDQASTLASALGALGWSVWWDRKIVAGQAFDEVIERELETAKSIVVLWSKHSTASEWVRNEAAVASERGVLVPAVIESVKLPLEFRRKQTADLIGWNGDLSHRGFQALCEGVSATAGGAQLHPSASRPGRLGQRRRWALAVISAMVIAFAVGMYYIHLRPTKPTPISENYATDAGTFSETKDGSNPVGGPADLALGTYSGDVISDSKGGTRTQVNLTVTKLDKWTVWVASDYPRLGVCAVKVTLTRIGNKILNAGGDTTFLLDLEQRPPRLDYNPHSEVAYSGSKQTPPAPSEANGAPSPLQFDTRPDLPDGTVAQYYEQTLSASDGTRPYTWSCTEDMPLPPGFQLDPNGKISGTPTKAGAVKFIVTVADRASASVTKELTIRVDPPKP